MPLEYERTFLAKYLPSGLENCQHKEILDIWIPTDADMRVTPGLRIRKIGERYEVTKKYPVDEKDAAVQHEFTAPLIKEEFDELERCLAGKRARKIRYLYPSNGVTFEIDVFQDKLRGLVLVDAEFSEGKGMNELQMPEFCLADVTQEKFIKGGMLAGKTYADIEAELKRFRYTKIESS